MGRALDQPRYEAQKIQRNIDKEVTMIAEIQEKMCHRIESQPGRRRIESQPGRSSDVLKTINDPGQTSQSYFAAPMSSSVSAPGSDTTRAMPYRDGQQFQQSSYATPGSVPVSQRPKPATIHDRSAHERSQLSPLLKQLSERAQTSTAEDSSCDSSLSADSEEGNSEVEDHDSTRASRKRQFLDRARHAIHLYCQQGLSVEQAFAAVVIRFQQDSRLTREVALGLLRIWVKIVEQRSGDSFVASAANPASAVRASSAIPPVATAQPGRSPSQQQTTTKESAWVEFKASHGRSWYWNRETSERSWAMPPGFGSSGARRWPATDTLSSSRTHSRLGHGSTQSYTSRSRKKFKRSRERKGRTVFLIGQLMGAQSS